MGIRILLSVDSIFEFSLSKVDGKTAFPKTGKAQRYVYNIPPASATTEVYLYLYY